MRYFLILMIVAFLQSDAFAQLAWEHPRTAGVIDMSVVEPQLNVAGCNELSMRQDLQRNFILCSTWFSTNYYWHGRMISEEEFNGMVKTIRALELQRQKEQEDARKEKPIFVIPSWMPWPQWGIFKEISSGTAQPLLIAIGVIGFFYLICLGIYRYQEQIRETHDYPLFEWVNIAIHGGIWIVFWLMVIGGCFGRVIEPTEWAGCPALASMVMLGLFTIPVYRTNCKVNNWGESIVINLFQTIVGFLIASIIMCIFAFSKSSKKNN
jgi:uncharacterized protein involved in tolerance to divalent cations